jgi:hypothetical protein
MGVVGVNGAAASCGASGAVCAWGREARVLVRRMMYAALLSRWARRVAQSWKAAVPPTRCSLRFEAKAAMHQGGNVRVSRGWTL